MGVGVLRRPPDAVAPRSGLQGPQCRAPPAPRPHIDAVQPSPDYSSRRPSQRSRPPSRDTSRTGRQVGEPVGFPLAVAAAAAAPHSASPASPQHRSWELHPPLRSLWTLQSGISEPATRHTDTPVTSSPGDPSLDGSALALLGAGDPRPGAPCGPALALRPRHSPSRRPPPTHPEHGLRLLRRRFPPRGECELRPAAPSPALAALPAERDPGKPSRARPPSPHVRPAPPARARAAAPRRSSPGAAPTLPPPRLGLAGVPSPSARGGPAPSERLRARSCRPLHRPGRAPPPRRPRPEGSALGSRTPSPAPTPPPPSGERPPRSAPGRAGVGVRGVRRGRGWARTVRGVAAAGGRRRGLCGAGTSTPGPAGVPHPTGGPRTFRGLRGRAGGARHLLREGGRVPGHRGTAPHSRPRPLPPLPPTAMSPGAKLKFCRSLGPGGAAYGRPSAGSARPALSPAGLPEGRERAACPSKLGPRLKVLLLRGRVSEVGPVSPFQLAEHLSTGGGGDKLREQPQGMFPGPLMLRLLGRKSLFVVGAVRPLRTAPEPADPACVVSAHLK